MKKLRIVLICLIIILNYSISLYSQTNANDVSNNCVKITAINRQPLSGLYIESDAQTLVNGSICDTNLTATILIHPLADDKWWVQSPTTSMVNKLWESFCRLGQDLEGEGEFFEIVAIASEKSLKEGKQFKSIADDWIRSDIVTVSFGQPKMDILNLTELPKNLMSNVKHKVMICGKATNSSLYAFVAIHPMNTNKWWIQRPASPTNPDGSWRTIGTFGTEIDGDGALFQIAVIYSKNSKEFSEGQQLNQLPNQVPTITVRRVEPRRVRK